jgi:hypothetical protein
MEGMLFEAEEIKSCDELEVLGRRGEVGERG